MGNPAASITSIGSRAAWQPDFRGLASGQLRAARERLGLDQDGFASYLGRLLGWTVMPATVARWEEGSVPPGDVLLAAAVAADERYGLDPDEALGIGAGPWIPLADPEAAQGPLTGIWLSAYSYVSSSRDNQEFTSEHYVVLIQYGSNIQVRSLPDTAAGRMAMNLTANGQVVTGTWTEQTDPDGHYSGSTYHGAIQMLLGATADRMAGRWVGYGRDFDVNTGAWSLKLVATPASRANMERFNKPVA
jgi:transcriptional regulator with XRE-family HTH domain